MENYNKIMPFNVDKKFLLINIIAGIILIFIGILIIFKNKQKSKKMKTASISCIILGTLTLISAAIQLYI